MGSYVVCIFHVARRWEEGIRGNPCNRVLEKNKSKRNRKYDIHQIHTFHPYQFRISTVGVRTDVSEKMHWKRRSQPT